MEARRLLLGLSNVEEGRSYGSHPYLLNGRFLARFHDDDTVLVLQLATIGERDVLMELDPDGFFFTEHYRNYPAVLIRLAEVPSALLSDVVTESWRHVAALPRHGHAGNLEAEGGVVSVPGLAPREVGVETPS